MVLPELQCSKVEEVFHQPRKVVWNKGVPQASWPRGSLLIGAAAQSGDDGDGACGRGGRQEDNPTPGRFESQKLGVLMSTGRATVSTLGDH